MTAMYVIIILVALTALLILIPVKVIADVSYKSDRNTVFVKLLFFRFTLYPSQEIKKDEEEAEKDVETEYEDEEKTRGVTATIKLINKIWQCISSDVKKIINYMLKKALTVNCINISGVIGTGNPMYTGMLYGMINAGVFGFLGAADSEVRIKKHNVNLKADFDNAILSAGIYTELQLRIKNVIVVLVRSFFIYIKIKRNLKEVKTDE